MSEYNKEVILKIGIVQSLRITGKALQFERSTKSQVESAGRTMCDIADIIEQQDKELEALRKAIAEIRQTASELMFFDGSDLGELLVKHGLIDESGNPTKLLTGE